MNLKEMWDDSPGLTLAWVGADGGAIVLAVEQLTNATLLADTGSPELVAILFGVAGGVGLADKLGLIHDD
jgi:hypothetical protein